MLLHAFFDVLRDGYFFSSSIRKLIIIDWHGIKTLEMIFFAISIVFLLYGMKRDWEFIIGLFIFRWGACEYFWNILDKSYAYNTKFMGLSAWRAIFIMIAGIILPIISQGIFNVLYTKQIVRGKKWN